MSVGDSAEELMSVHALGRERLLVLSSVKSAPSFIFSLLGDDRVLVSVFYTPAVKCVFNTSLIGARHKSPAVE